MTQPTTRLITTTTVFFFHFVTLELNIGPLPEDGMAQLFVQKHIPELSIIKSLGKAWNRPSDVLQERRTLGYLGLGSWCTVIQIGVSLSF
jgi:hypothetical protein